MSSCTNKLVYPTMILQDQNNPCVVSLTLKIIYPETPFRINMTRNMGIISRENQPELLCYACCQRRNSTQAPPTIGFSRIAHCIYILTQVVAVVFVFLCVSTLQNDKTEFA